MNKPKQTSELRGRGRPRKEPSDQDTVSEKPKRGRGRPAKPTKSVTSGNMYDFLVNIPKK